MDPAGAAVKSRVRTPTLQHLWVSRNCTLFAPDTSGFHESTKRVGGQLRFAEAPTPPKKIIRCLYKQFSWKKKKNPLIPITQDLPYPPATVHTSDVMDTNPRTGKVKNQLLKLTQVPGR